MMNRLGRIARAIEFTVAGLLTLEVLVLHFNVMRHAGPLWRDEISSLRVATMPTWGGLWSSLVYDPVPALFFGILRLWNWLFAGATDESLRYLGLLVGTGIVAAIWCTAWIIKKAPPTWAMLLFGLSPVALVWGDSMRAYGIGCLFSILAIAFLWKLVCERPRRIDMLLAAAAALLSVQSLFSNSLLVFAAIAGAVVVTVHRGWRRTTVILLGIGALAALSLLPYIPIIRETQSWSDICKSPISFGWIFAMLFRATASGGNLAAALWVIGGTLACLTLALTVVRPRLFNLGETDTNLVLYAGTTLIIAIALNICFFRWVGWATSLWYYLPLMATAVFCLEAVSTLLRRSALAVTAHSLFVALAAAAVSPLAYQATHVRLTNVDLTAKIIAEHAQVEDLVVVDYYLYAISFQRYYHGQAPWVSVPDVSDLSLHRWDLLSQTMDRPHPVEPILKRIEETLQAGHDVYVAGLAPINHETVAPPDLPTVSQNNFGRILWPYVRRWSSQVAYTAQTHASRGVIIPILAKEPISTAENIRAFAVSGWKDGDVAASR